VSTAPIVTEISGRGIGLAIVQERMEQLGGTVTVRSTPGGGCSFRMVLPVAQSTFRGVIVAAAGQWFVLPTAKVERVHRTPVADVKTVENRETVSIAGTAVALVRLADVLELATPPAAAPSEFLELVVIGAGERRIAFAVDAIVREEEVLVKPLRLPLRRVRNVAGATVLGSGRVVPVLHVADLLKSALATAAAGARGAAPAPRAEPKRRSILIAEDSITSRTLLQNILQSAGYVVKTAIDGQEALSLLRTEPFDLLISDVEMPRLNGFALTQAIRQDRKLAELPVILVTALGSREDRERGVDAGANAYLVKSGFEQGNLLETVRRFL
jgi:two-component system, chemotaxis family, sensor kinase CheA